MVLTALLVVDLQRQWSALDLPQNNLKQFGWLANKYLLSDYWLPGTILGTGDRAMSRLVMWNSLYQWGLVVLERNSK